MVTAASFVARGNRVPWLFPWSSLLVLLLQGLQVRCQDQVSDRERANNSSTLQDFQGQEEHVNVQYYSC